MDTQGHRRISRSGTVSYVYGHIRSMDVRMYIHVYTYFYRKREKRENHRTRERERERERARMRIYGDINGSHLF